MIIRIKHYSFELAEPFAEGHKLTVAEAQALNRLRAENIRNNMAKVVVDAVAALPDGALLSHETVTGLQERIAEYDRNYQFQPVHQSQFKPGALASEVKAIARDHVLLQARREGEALEDDEIEVRVQELIKADWVQQAARDKLSRRVAISTSAISELL